jgi:hypothetical protein
VAKETSSWNEELKNAGSALEREAHDRDDYAVCRKVNTGASIAASKLITSDYLALFQTQHSRTVLANCRV